MLTSERENTYKIIKQHEKEEQQFREENSSLNEKVKEDETELRGKEKEAKQFYTQFKELFKKRDRLQEEIKKLERQADEHDIRIKGLEQKIGIVNVEKAKTTAELAGLHKEFEQYVKVDISNVRRSEEELKKDINKYERMLENVGSVNMKALEIYEQAEKEYHNLLEKKDKLGQEKEEIFMLMNEIETNKKDIFMKSFNVINENFKRIFSELSRKGEAYLELEDPETVFEGGLNLRVRITGNRFMDLKSLSGGEKSLTALAFIFSIQEYEPASFYVLDEVDAALDKHNSEKLAKLIGKYAANAQYVVISHNDAVISEANLLYGISMNEHSVSNATSLKI
jgi:chromosome segregation protein